MPGPIPKRSDQRRRENKSEDIEIDKHVKGAKDVEVPVEDPIWEDATKRWYASLAESGQVAYYEPSDWAQAWIWAELLDRELKRGKPSAMMIAQWASGAAELLTTEGARRRMRIELAKNGLEDTDLTTAISDLDAFRDRKTS